jgi:hypothetical protein
VYGPVQTEPIKAIHARAIPEIEDALVRLDRGDHLKNHLSSLRKSSVNQTALDAVIKHVAELTCKLEGVTLSHERYGDGSILSGEPSPYLVLLVKLSDLAYLFPKQESHGDRDISAQGTVVLEKMLEVNRELVAHFAQQPGDILVDRAIIQYPILRMRSTFSGKRASELLQSALERGYFEDAKELLERCPVTRPELLELTLYIFENLHGTRRFSKEAVITVSVECLRGAERVGARHAGVDKLFLQSILATSESPESAKSQADALEVYIEGLEKQGETRVHDAVLALACVENGLTLYPELVEAVLLVNQQLNFVRLDRLELQPHPGEVESFVPQPGAVGARIRELAAFIKNPAFRKDSPLATVVFVGSDESCRAGSAIHELEDNGYLVLPASAANAEELAKACKRTAMLGGRATDVLMIVGDFRNVEVPDDLLKFISPATQILIFGEHSTSTHTLSARAAHVATGCETFGAKEDAHGVRLHFTDDNTRRIASVEFISRWSERAEVKVPGLAERVEDQGQRPKKARSAESQRYPARKPARNP